MKNHNSFQLLCLLLFSLLPLMQLHAAVNRSIRFTHLTNNEGLPTNTVFTTCQDYKGFIWIGTKNGLCKYDGKTVVHYDIGSTGNRRLSNSTIRHIYEDSRRRLWVVAQKEVNLYDREKDLFNCIDTDSLLSYRRVICEDRDGTIYLAGSSVVVYNEQLKVFEPLRLSNGQTIQANIPTLTIDTRRNLWIGKEHTGLIRFDLERSTKTELHHDANDPYSLPSDKIVSLYTDRNGDVWVGTLDKGVGRHDRNTGRFHRLEGFPDICVRSFAEDTNGDIWIGSENGLYIYQPSTGKLMCHRQNYNDRYSLNDNAIYSVYRDRENNMLTSTYFGGINIYPNSFRQFFHYDYGYSEKHLSGKAVRQILGDRNGNLWIATEDGGLNYYDHNREVFNHIKPVEGSKGLSYHNVHSVLEASDGMLWIGTFLGGLNKYNPATGQFTHYSSRQYEGLAFDNIFVLLEDRNKRIWIGTTNGLSIYDPASQQFSRVEPEVIGSQGIDHLLEDVEGNIWIATRTHGVYCYHPSGKLVNYAYKPDGSCLPDNCVNYVYEDSDRNIWLATNEGGLCKYNRHTGSFSTLTERDGLPSNTIFGIIESNSGNLWISTNNGLSCLAINDYTFTNYSISEGLPNKQFNYNSAYKAADGMLFFGTINGMVSFYPEELQTIRNVAQVEFSAFRVFGKQIRPGDKDSPLLKNISEVNEIRLNSEQAKSFTLEFTVPTLSHPNSIFFATRFKGDKDWVYIGSQNHITYANLPPGEYELSVKAAFNNKWTGTEPVKSIRIIVMPPFWQSSVAYFIYFLVSILLFCVAYLFIRRRQEEKRIILAERLEKEKIKEINTLKLNFFTNISHELRTPLTLILTPLQSYLEKNVFSADIKPKMKLVADNAQRMNNLVDELILFSKIETRQESIRVKRGDILQFVETICMEFQSLAEEKGLTYKIDIHPSECETWFAPVKVEKIIYNLLSNAFKYTNTGSVTVDAACRIDEGFNYLCLTVADTGVGIAADQIEHIFENYYQVNDFVNGKKTGFGIGLSLVRELVNLHKGSINVDSIPDKGTVFTIRINVSAAAFAPEEISPNDADNLFLQNYKFLQVAATVPSGTTETHPETGQTGNEQYKLLLVEDNKELLAAYTELFSDTYTVLTAGNGEEGLKVAGKQLPDIIISDVMMPVMDGFRMTGLLKSGLETCHIPVILLTAKTGEQAQMEGYDCGADLYIEKPFHPALLYKQIANLLATKEHERRRYRSGDIDIVEVDANEKDKCLIAKVEGIIIEHLGESSFSLNDLLREAAVGRTLLHVKLKSILGLSTTEFINKVRLNESIKLLAKGKNVSEAAYATGFSSPNYYSRCFRKYYGMAPNEYVKKGSTAPAEPTHPSAD